MSDVPAILGAHHAQITIPRGEEDAARRFYCDLLGLHEVQKPEALAGRGGFWLQLNHFQVHIGTEDRASNSDSKAHVAYQVSSLDGWRGKLEDAGVSVIDGIQIPGCRRFEFRDPFGNRVEFLETH